MPVKPVILFVHGSWHTPEHFGAICDVFKQAGYESICPRQPSVGNLPPAGMIDDAACITDELTRLVESEGKDVAVVAHSYGGIVATQGVKASLGKAARASNGKQGGVLRVIYLTAFLVPLGCSLSTLFGGIIPDFIPVDEQEMCIMSNPENRFYNDLSAEGQEKWTRKLLKSPASTQLACISQTAYTCHPVSYIYCALDQALPLSVQKEMVGVVSKQYNLDIPTSVLPAGHSPYLSMPGQVLIAVEQQLWTVHG